MTLGALILGMLAVLYVGRKRRTLDLQSYLIIFMITAFEVCIMAYDLFTKKSPV